MDNIVFFSVKSVKVLVKVIDRKEVILINLQISWDVVLSNFLDFRICLILFRAFLNFL